MHPTCCCILTYSISSFRGSKICISRWFCCFKKLRAWTTAMLEERWLLPHPSFRDEQLYLNRQGPGLRKHGLYFSVQNLMPFSSFILMSFSYRLLLNHSLWCPPQFCLLLFDPGQKSHHSVIAVTVARISALPNHLLVNYEFVVYS